MSVKPIPEGYTSLTPFLCIDGASAAIDFYISVFGAELVDRMDGPGGTVAHAELDFGNGRLQLSDPQDAYQLAAPELGASVTHSVALYCDDTDAIVARAEKAGATIREAAQTFVTGDRFRIDSRPVRAALDRDDPRRGRLPRGAGPPHGRVGQGERLAVTG